MKEIFVYFIRLGTLGFGGPLALVAQMQKELVQEKKWIAEDEFRAIFGVIKAMPGPVAFQTAMFLCYRRAGFKGALIGGLAMLFPSFVMMILLAMFYSQFTENPLLKSVMTGMQLGAFALILGALKSLATGFLDKVLFWVLLLAGIVLAHFAHVPEPILIIVFGLLTVTAARMPSKKLNVMDPVLGTLALVCLKAGAFVFGSGLAIVPFLEKDFVTELGWLTHSEFMDALAFGQLTPGPVVMTVTFIGYKVSGLIGALTATTAIFLPAFIHMTTWFPRAEGWLLRQKWIASFTMGVMAAVCATILLALYSISHEWTMSLWTGAVIMIVVMLLTKLPSWLIVLLGGVVGVGLNFLS